MSENMEELELSPDDECLLTWTAAAFGMSPEKLLEKTILLGVVTTLRKRGKLGREDDFRLDGLN